MLNKEKYADEILSLAIKGEMLAVVDNKVVPCSEARCNECLFYREETGECESARVFRWANEKYVKPDPIWSDVPVDTPVLVMNSIGIWYRRYFAFYKNGRVYVWLSGATSWSANSKDAVSSNWEKVELAEDEEV